MDTIKTQAFADLLAKPVSEPGSIHATISPFHGYSLGNQIVAIQLDKGRAIWSATHIGGWSKSGGAGTATPVYSRDLAKWAMDPSSPFSEYLTTMREKPLQANDRAAVFGVHLRQVKDRVHTFQGDQGQAFSVGNDDESGTNR